MYTCNELVKDLASSGKKILLVGKPGAGKSFLLNSIKGLSSNSEVKYFDSDDSMENYSTNSFLTASSGAIATIQASNVEEAINNCATHMGISSEEVKSSIDCVVLVDRGAAIIQTVVA